MADTTQRRPSDPSSTASSADAHRRSGDAFGDDWYLHVAMPALLRHARAAYGSAMRQELEAAGFDDIPGNGLYVIGGLALDEAVPLGDLIRQLRISKQAAGQLVDTLVSRGYLDRAVDHDDRRRLTISLTDRGRAAASVQSAAREAVDARLVAQCGTADVERTRRTLAVLCLMGRGEDGSD
jgi:DNA-binding MarR family transcriptional regulator